MTIEDKIAVLAVTFYMSMAIVTFGHSANNPRIEPVAHAVGVDLATTALWPLYWSWELQK